MKVDMDGLISIQDVLLHVFDLACRTPLDFQLSIISHNHQLTSLQPQAQIHQVRAFCPI